MDRYDVPEPVRGEVWHPLYGRITYEFDAGEHVPQSEAEEYVFAQVLVPWGRATAQEEE